MNNAEIKKRFIALELERRGSVEQLWDLIERFVLPFRGDFYQSLNSEHEVDWHRRDIYDSTAVFAVQSLAASLQGNLTSPSQKWFDLRFRDQEVAENDAAMEWLENVSFKIHEALQDSNFNIEIAESYIDLVGFGTTVLTEEHAGKDDLVWEGLNFQALPVREMFFEEDHKKGVHILYRRMQMTAVQMISQFGEDGVPQNIRDLAKTPEAATTRHKVIFSVFPRPNKKNADTGKPLGAKERPFGHKYILFTGAKTLGEEGGYYEMPAFVGRWRKVAGSRWGHSPASVALADILTANQIIEAMLEAASKNIDPTTFANETALIGDLDLDRGSLNIVNDIDGIRIHESGSRFDTGAIQLDRLQEQIRAAFYQDQLELKDSPAMTATEVNARMEMIQRLIGPTFGRLQSDILDPLVQRSFNIMYRAGQLPDLPEGLEISQMDIEYTGPLPRAQRMETAQAIERWAMGLAEMAEVFPDALDLYDSDRAELYKARLMGVPAVAMRGAEEVESMREERKKAQAKQQAIAEAGATGEAASAVGAGAEATGVEPAALLQAVQGGKGQ
jgi:hypothetical protein